MRRTLQTVAVPVFQFGMFSENDLSFLAGPNFNFGGRVHTNANLYLASGNGTTLTLADRVTAVGEVIRTQPVERLGHERPTTPAPSGSSSRAERRSGNLARTEGSLVTNDSGRAERAEVDDAVGRHLRQQHPERPDRRAAARPAARVAGRRGRST